jgi:hypothetical protein
MDSSSEFGEREHTFLAHELARVLETGCTFTGI